jgi:anti-sigma factor RsiW
MTCQELVELVTAYLEGKLPERERTAFEEHLQDCTACTEYLDQMRRTVHLLGQLPPEALSVEARERLLAAFADWSGDAGPSSP